MSKKKKKRNKQILKPWQIDAEGVGLERNQKGKISFPKVFGNYRIDHLGKP